MFTSILIMIYMQLFAGLVMLVVRSKIFVYFTIILYSIVKPVEHQLSQT